MTVDEIDAMIADRRQILDDIAGKVDGTEAGRSVSFSAMRKSLWDEIKELQLQRAQYSEPVDFYGIAGG